MSEGDKLKSTKNDQHDANKSESQLEKKPNEFVFGLVTFAIFMVFMTVWMYLSA
ncbi:hypothetical protein MNBD_GAMMA06-1872 [hydrothermal vent metagenome]|uniref:Uncharacterized protein n=1 Tax=hydrothermal vent metagenome TaxID=652676 RepID=A0A3B0WHR4_9ZZZZ